MSEDKSVAFMSAMMDVLEEDGRPVIELVGDVLQVLGLVMAQATGEKTDPTFFAGAVTFLRAAYLYNCTQAVVETDNITIQ